MAKATFVLDDETMRTIRALAERTRKPQSRIVRDAVAAFAAQEEKLSDEDRAKKLAILDALMQRPRTRPQAAVDAELRGIRRARRAGWRRPSD